MTDTAGSPAIDPFHVWLGLDVKADGIPFALKSIDQWVLWKAEPRAEGKGTNKVPYQCNEQKASSTKPETWADFTSVMAELGDDETAFSGAGFVVRAENGILVLDFDHVRNAHTGEIDEVVLGAVRYLGTYAEVSPSGTGIRIIGYGTMDRAITSKTLQGWVTGRFVTITGHRLDGVSADINHIDPAKLADVATWFSDKPAPAASTQAANAPTGYALDVRQVLEIRQALGYVDPDESYDIWVQVGMALQSTGADNAFGLWNEWSQVGPKYNAAIMRAKWASFRDRPNGINLPTVFKLAQDRGWVNPATREALAFETRTGLSYEEANRRQPEVGLIRETPSIVLPFPVPGLDEVAEWIESFAAAAYPSVTQQAVLALVSVVVSRIYVTPQGDPLSLYLGCCGRSVGELRYVHHAVSAAMSAASLRRMIRATRMTSPMTIYKSLLRSPSTLYLSDDYGGVAAFSKRQPSGLQEHALALMSSLHDGKSIQLDGPEEAGLRAGAGQVVDEQPVIYAPSLSVLALIGLDQLATLMRQSETGRGALQQMLFTVGDERTLIEREPTNAPPPVWLPNHMRQVRRVPHPELGTDLSLADIFNNCVTVAPSPAVVPFQAPLQPVYSQLDAISNDRRVRSLLLAARGTVRRIAAALAAWGSPDAPVVTAKILDWTGEYVCARMRETVEQFEILHSTDGRSSVYDQVLAVVTQAKTKGVSNRDLCRECWAFRGLSGEKRGELIGLMLADRAIAEVSVMNPKTKRNSKVFVAARFTTDGGDDE
jgi:hypothetical protein